MKYYVFVMLLVVSNGIFAQSTLPPHPNTGNPSKDAATYDVEKRLWIAKNPEAYRQLGGDPNAVKEEIIAQPVDVPAIKTTGASMPADYPVYRDSGDLNKDMTTYDAAKQSWIAKNPEVYRKLGGNPEVIQQQTTPVEDKSTKKEVVDNFQAVETYLLLDTEPIPMRDGIAAATLVEERERMQKKYNSVMMLAKDEQQHIRFVPLQKMKPMRGEEHIQGNSVEWRFQEAECETCRKTLYLDLVSKTDEQIIYIMHDEDEDPAFHYRFTFQRIANR